MIIILADAELELIPEEMKKDEDVRKYLRKMGKEDSILDNFLLRSSIGNHFPSEVNRIGFPQIAYQFYRLNEETLLGEGRKLDYAIHTKNNDIIEKVDLRDCGSSYWEFVETVEELLTKRRKRMGILEYLEEKGILGNTVVLHPRGRQDLVVNDQLNYVIGGFPEGDFRSNLEGLRKFSIHDREVTVPGILEMLHFKLLLSSSHS